MNATNIVPSVNKSAQQKSFRWNVLFLSLFAGGMIVLAFLIGKGSFSFTPFDERPVDHAYLKEQVLGKSFEGFMPPLRLTRSFSVRAFRWEDGLNISLELECSNNGRSVWDFESTCKTAASNYIAAVDQLYAAGFEIQTWSGTLLKNYTSQETFSGGRSKAIRTDLAYTISFNSVTSPATFQVVTTSQLSAWPNPGDVWVGLETARSFPVEELPKLMVILDRIAGEVKIKFDAAKVR